MSGAAARHVGPCERVEAEHAQQRRLGNNEVDCCFLRRLPSAALWASAITVVPGLQVTHPAVKGQTLVNKEFDLKREKQLKCSWI